MPDDLANRGAHDRARINMDEEHEVEFWTNELGVNAQTLKQVIAQTGNSAKAVREHLQRRLGAH
jgi:predicted RNA-binding protein YlqC (UPF0109 family)